MKRIVKTIVILLLVCVQKTIITAQTYDQSIEMSDIRIFNKSVQGKILQNYPSTRNLYLDSKKSTSAGLACLTASGVVGISSIALFMSDNSPASALLSGAGLAASTVGFIVGGIVLNDGLQKFEEAKDIYLEDYYLTEPRKQEKTSLELGFSTNGLGMVYNF